MGKEGERGERLRERGEREGGGGGETEIGIERKGVGEVIIGIAETYLKTHCPEKNDYGPIFD